MASIPSFALISLLLLSSFRGISSSKIVTLGSIETFNTHEWFPMKPTVYFKCQDGNKTYLPDVKKKHFLYSFKGEESWQPLTELPDKKCKRCGFYEEDVLKKDDVFDEWELCSSEFVDGLYVRFKENEFNATFICPECTSSTGSNQTFAPSEEVDKKLNVFAIIVICASASIVAVGGTYLIYWQKRKSRGGPSHH